MEKEKVRVIKAYLKSATNAQVLNLYVNLVRDLPLNTLLFLENYNGISYILKINYFRRKESEINVSIYAITTHSPFFNIETNRYITQILIELSSIKSWKLWTPELAPLTINWSMTNWYKAMAFGQ